MTYVAERICGICSFIHGQSYCQAIEGVMKIDVPERALYLRTIWGEMSRIHSHLLWLGLFADGFGFESLFMHSWRVREKLLDLVEETTGGRVIFGTAKVGGVRRDMESLTLKRVETELRTIEKQSKELTDVFKKDSSVMRRTKGIGILTKEDAIALGAVGPTLRGSGVASDMRKLGYAAYAKINWEPAIETGCDLLQQVHGPLPRTVYVVRHDLSGNREDPGRAGGSKGNGKPGG